MQPRPALPQFTDEERLARSYRRLPPDEGHRQIMKAHRLHDAERFGRWIGIILHWLIIKPIQIALNIPWFCWFFLTHLQEFMVLAVGLFLLYFFGVIVWLAYITFW